MKQISEVGTTTAKASSSERTPCSARPGPTVATSAPTAPTMVRPTPTAAGARVADARALEDAGAWGIVLEMVPASVTRQVIERIEIPTIGIGAGNGTSGQVLVCYDMLGLTDDFQPRFLKRFEQLGERVREATGAYLEQVRNRSYPGDEHSY